MDTGQQHNEPDTEKQGRKRRELRTEHHKVETKVAGHKKLIKEAGKKDQSLKDTQEYRNQTKALPAPGRTLKR